MKLALIVVAVAALSAGPAQPFADEPWIRHSTFADFSAGTLGDGGSNLFVSRRGVEMIHRWDLDNDGYLDLWVGQDHNPVENEDLLVYWNGAQGLRSLLPDLPSQQPLGRLLRQIRERERHVTRLPSEGGGRSLVVDLNNDGFAEIVFCNFIHNYSVYMNAIIYWGSAEGYRPDRRTLLPTLLADGVAAADFNRDGFVDLAFSNRGIEGGERFGFDMHLESYVYWNGPTGFAEDRRTVLPTISAIDCAAGDLDGDGWPDLLFANNNSQHKSFYLYWGGPQGFSAERRDTWSDGDPTSLRLVDLDRDGKLDLLVTDRGKQASVYRGAARGFDRAAWVRLPISGAAESHAADLDRDGFLDLVFPNPTRSGHGASYVYWGSAGGFAPARRLELPTLSATGAASGDFNGDGLVDLVFANEHDERTYDVNSYIYWNSPKGFQAANRTDLQGFGSVGALAADLDHDGRSDLVLVSRNSGSFGPIDSFIYWGNPAHRYSPAKMTILPGAGTGEAVCSIADFNGDGRVDIAYPNGRIYWGGKDGFTPKNRLDLGIGNGRGTTVADLNRDGHLDLVVATGAHKPNTSRALIFWGSATGFARERTTELTLSTRISLSASVADLDKDGRLDLVFSDVDSEALDIFWGTASGFGPGRETRLQVQSAASTEIADCNGDGWLDLILGGGWDRPRFGRPTRQATILWGGPDGFSPARAQKLEAFDALEQAVADLDKDGYLDLVLTNYHAYLTRTVPAFIYWGGPKGYSESRRTSLPAESSSALTVADLDQDGWMDLVVFNHVERGDHSVGANIFWGGPKGYSYARRQWFPTFGPHFGVRRDVGNIYDRKLREEFVSRPLECPAGKRPARLSWRAETPHGTRVRMQVRAAGSEAELAKAPWRGPAGADSFYERPEDAGDLPAGRWFQYKAVLATPDGGSTPLLQAVEVTVRPN